MGFEAVAAAYWSIGCPPCERGGGLRISRKDALAGRPNLPALRDGWEARLGLWKCNERECRKQFTVKVGTVFEHGRIPLHKMLQAVFLLCCSKKGCSSHQLHRILQITYKSAWFLSHRIREAMRDGALTPMGGARRIVEMDETAQVRIEGAPKQAHRGMGMGPHSVYVGPTRRIGA